MLYKKIFWNSKFKIMILSWDLIILYHNIDTINFAYIKN